MWKRGNAANEADYERRLLQAYDILLSYPVDSATIAKRSTQQDKGKDERDHTHARKQRRTGARVES